MTGNVEEWEWSCAIFDPDAGGYGDGCLFRGGSFATLPNSAKCTDLNAYSAGRDFQASSIGIRCCAQ